MSVYQTPESSKSEWCGLLWIYVLTVVDDQILDITHNLCIALIGVGRDYLKSSAVFLADGRRLGMQHEGDCEQALARVFSDAPWRPPAGGNVL